MAMTVEVQPVVLDAEDAARRLPELRLARQRFALDAQSDAVAAAELADIEGQIAACLLALERRDLADAERVRRDAEARAAEEEAAREAALEQARVLQAERERAMRAVDSGARRFACALVDYDRICREQDGALTTAGRRPSANAGRAREAAIQAAVAYALREASAPRVLELPPIPVRDVKPLAESDLRPIEPTGN